MSQLKSGEHFITKYSYDIRFQPDLDFSDINTYFFLEGWMYKRFLFLLGNFPRPDITEESNV